MDTLTLTDALAELPVFKGMSREALTFVSGCAREVHFKRGDFLLYIGKPTSHFYLILQGEIALEMEAANKIATLQTLNEGSIVGWSWLVPPFTSHFDARAATSVSAISFDAVRIRKQCDQDPVFGYQILKRFSRIMGNRLRNTRIQLADLYR